MLTTNDCLLLLSELVEQECDGASELLTSAFTKQVVDYDIVKFINDNRPLEIIKFYNLIRENHNKNKSKLYTNILKETNNPIDVVTTLSAMLVQILLYNKKIEDRGEKLLFLKHSRASEISKALTTYFDTYSFEAAIKVITLIRADIKAFEFINGRRESPSQL